VIVLVPKSAVEDEATRKKLALNKSVTDLVNARNVSLPLEAAKALLRNSNPTDTFEFGGVKGCLSTMEIYRNGRYENYPCTRTVDSHILRLRKKLEADRAHPKHFHTVHCAGYKFLP
jgi:hypothetical protein